jgi:hypothetical protein
MEAALAAFANALYFLVDLRVLGIDFSIALHGRAFLCGTVDATATRQIDFLRRRWCWSKRIHPMYPSTIRWTGRYQVCWCPVDPEF